MTHNFVDAHGRWHSKPVKKSNPYPCNNAFLYSGYAYLLGLGINFPLLIGTWQACQRDFGYDRHPNGDIFPNSAHDELVGMALVCSVLHTTEELLRCEDNLWQVCNLPNFEPRRIWSLNPFRVIKDYYALFKERDEQGRRNPRKFTYKYPYIAPICFRITPQHTYFILRCSGSRVGILHSLYFIGASTFTILSGEACMLGFKLIKLDRIGMNWAEKLVKKMFNMKDWIKSVEKEFEQYKDEHPIVLKTKELYEGA